MEQPILMPFQDLPFNGDTFACEEFLKLKEKLGITAAIETGSCFYSTTKWLGENFDKVFTVEVNEDFAKYGRHKIADMNNVRADIDESVGWISKIAPLLTGEKCIYFLDAHWGGECPLLGEIEAISKIPSTQPPVIVIHDFFTGNPNLGYDEWNGQALNYEWVKPSIDKIEEALKCKYSYYFNSEATGALRGIIYLYPSEWDIYCETIPQPTDNSNLFSPNAPVANGITDTTEESDATEITTEPEIEAEVNELCEVGDLVSAPEAAPEAEATVAPVPEFTITDVPDFLIEKMNGGEAVPEVAPEPEPEPAKEISDIEKMPCYRHRKVWALKIKEIVLDEELAVKYNRPTDFSATIVPEEEGYANFKVNADYVIKNNPKVGGYFTIYEDGFQSFSTAEAFENGCRKIN